VWSIYNALVEKFSNEYNVLIEAPFEALRAVSNEKVAEMIVRVREGKIRVIPGYDGVYGRLDTSAVDSGVRSVPERVQQLNLTDFFG
jgi:PHP family Zn ribbon phosphoesterase